MRFVKSTRALGFSLIEIAIVLVVVGLIISGGLLGLSPVLQASKVTQTNAQMDKIEQALTLYVIQNGCLPCPASPAALTGIAKDSNGTYSTGCNSNGNSSSATFACLPTAATTQGILPWVNLGLAKTDVIDAYGFFIDYDVAATLNYTSTAMIRTLPSTYPAGTVTVTDASNTSQTTAAAYVLISHGADGYGGYTAAKGTQSTLSGNATADQKCNAVGQGCTLTSNAYVQDTPKGNGFANGYFDDIVRFRTAPVIIQSCGSNACGNPA